ncbi:hypothetical protein [Pseudomonas sp. Xaverov 83]|uniref:hypothetical protein n=1 Tax=Pseudomonas sp. Xaverov 83 TaxID=2666087 RepID=UPI00214C9DB0|nr:hypothetical protein [Pseudomonas sp. Xaverov 83]
MSVQTGSTTVAGANVDFAASSRVGDSFIGPDGVNYEVANVASSTVLSILPAYKGPTVSGAAYAIMPVQGYDKMLSDAFNALNNQFGPKLAALGTTGNYDILPVDKGGTGAITAPAARANLGLGTAATFNTGRAPGNVATAEMIGFVGSQSTVSWAAEVNPGIDNKVFASADFPGNPQGGSGLFYRQTIQFGTTGNRLMIAWPYGVAGNTGTIKMRSIYNGGFTPEIELYHTGNTTRAADGTLKAI